MVCTVHVNAFMSNSYQWWSSWLGGMGFLPLQVFPSGDGWVDSWKVFLPTLPVQHLEMDRSSKLNVITDCLYEKETKSRDEVTASLTVLTAANLACFIFRYKGE